MPGLVAATLQPPQAQGLGTFPFQVADGNGVIAAAASACSCLSCWNGAGTGWILSRAAKPQDPSQSMGSKWLHFSIQQQMEADAQFLRWWKS